MSFSKWLASTIALVLLVSTVIYVGTTEAYFADITTSDDNVLGFRWGLINLEDDFEGDDWDEQWNENGTTDWVQSSLRSHSAPYSVFSDTSSSGFLTSNDIDASIADNITLSFYYQADNLSIDNGVKLQGYNGVNYVDLAVITGSTSQWTMFSLTLTKAEYPQFFIPGFRVRFVSNLVCNQYVYIDNIGIITVNEAPVTPAGLVAEPGDRKVLLTWTPNQEVDIAGYRIYRSTDNSSFELIENLYPSANYTDTGLDNGETYYYRILAVDAAGNTSDPTVSVSATPLDLAPDTPTGLMAVAGDRQALLYWTGNTDLDLAGYNLYRRSSSNGTYEKVNSSLILAGTSNFTDTGLTGGVTYYYVVTAVDQTSLESGYSNEAEVTPYDNPPAAPTNLTATAVGNQINLEWTAVSESDVTGYHIYRSLTGSGNYTQIDTILVPSTTFSDLELTANVTYYYVVTAFDAVGQSSYSNEAYATIQGTLTPLTAISPITGTASVGQTLTAGTVSPSGATVNWQWQRSDSANGTYTNILDANANTYTLVSGDEGKYIRVVATGTGAYTGTVTSSSRGPVLPNPKVITAIGNIIGYTHVGATLTAGPLTPYGATATYQWIKSSTVDGTYEPIFGATAETYIVASEDYDCYFKVTANGSGIYTGTVTSSPTSRIAAGIVESIGDIIGTTKVGELLTAGLVFPIGATVTYQWQIVGDSGTANISGATSSTFTVTGAQNNQFIRVVVTGIGAYSGTVVSALTKSRVTPNIFTLTGMDTIAGFMNVGEMVSAGALTPEDATATYQWQLAASPSGPAENITGAVYSTYTIQPGDLNGYLRVIATGSGAYIGEITSSYRGPVGTATLISIGNIVGTTTVDQTLAAGVISPAGATVTYQWQKSATIGGDYTDIYGASTNIYTLTTDDVGFYLRVKATGTGSYTGTVTSAGTGPVTSVAIPITAIGPIAGTFTVGNTLSAGVLTPSGATATYQWQRSLNGGTYDNIAGATSSNYVVQAGDFGFYLRIIATGSGTYTGVVTSDPTGQTSAGPLQSISDIIGTTATDQTVHAGTVTPLGATVSYQWQISVAGSASSFTDIAGATEDAYHFVRDDYKNRYIRLKVTGYGSYSGTIYSNPSGPVVSLGEFQPLTAINDIIGTPQVAQTLTAGVLTPAGAFVTYQWQRSDTSNGTFSNIAGATANTYTPVAGDFNKFIRVVATGSGPYIGAVTSAPTSQITAAPLTGISPSSGTTTVGSTLTAGTLSPAGATAAYQWQRSLTAGGTYQDIHGETVSTYIIRSSDEGYYLKVKATGTGSYTGTVTSAASSRVIENFIQITDMENITGTARVGVTLIAGLLTPAGATVTWQWQRCSTSDGVYQNIDGATSATYTPPPVDFEKYLRVIATGSGGYSGTITSNPTAQVAAGIITGIGKIKGTTAESYTITAGEVSPAGATVSYQWQSASAGSTNWENITGATINTFFFQYQTYNQKYLRVVVTGSGAWTGTIYSQPVGSVHNTSTPVTSIGAISGSTVVGQTLIAGALTPNAASATYQWLRCQTINGMYEPITGYYEKTYTLSEADFGYYIKVAATGSGPFSGVVISNPTGPVTAASLTDISPVSGTTEAGRILTAGTVTPSGATVAWQWQRSNDGIDFDNISGATFNTYEIDSADLGYYLRVITTGTGSYSGTATSSFTGPVSESAEEITGIGAISGTVRVAQTLTAGTITPSEATITWQWQWCNVVNGNYQDIDGATSATYTLLPNDFGRYIRVKAIGSGGYSETAVSDEVGPVTEGFIAGIADIEGTVASGYTIFAGEVSPAGATVTYQWEVSASGSPANFSPIPGATADMLHFRGTTYNGRYFRVTVTGYGSYTGTTTSNYTGPFSSPGTAITALGTISGSAVAGQTLTAGSVTPSGATLVWQWQRSDTVDGAFANIVEATSNTYQLTFGDVGYYIRVVATGTGSYAGSIASNPVGPVFGTITSVTIAGTPALEELLAIDSLSPTGATATYQWQRSNTSDFTTPENITGATSATRTLTSADYEKYVRVVATGTGSYTGTSTSNAIGPVAVASLTAIAPINGTMTVGQILTAGQTTPSGAVVTWQWQRSSTSNFSASANITGAISGTYTLTNSDFDSYIRVVATGISGYEGTVTSAAAGPVSAALLTAIEPVNGMTVVGQTLSAGQVTPSGATVSWQWQRSDNASGNFSDIGGATSDTYTLTAADADKYIRVVATGTGDGYVGTVTSAVVGPVVAGFIEITGIGDISGTARFGQTLTAGSVTPSGATYTLQWQRSTTGGFSTSENITGATSGTYTLAAADIGKYIRVVATGTGIYTGTQTSNVIGVIGKGIITGIGDIIGTPVIGNTLTAGVVIPEGATVTYQWQKSWYNPQGGNFQNITDEGADTPTLYLRSGIARWVRVVVTGSGNWEGTIISNYVEVQ